MHPNERRAILIDHSFDQSKVVRPVQFRSVKMEIKVAVVGRQFYDLLQFDQLFFDATMRDKALNCADTQMVFLTEFHQLWQPRHRAIVVQNFAEHARWFETCHARQVHCRFRMSGPSQHAAILGPERENVPGLNQVLG